MRMLTAERLRELLHYDPETGVFTRKTRSAKCVYVGDVAGSVNKHIGYVLICIEGGREYAHRLAWLYVYGEWPKQLDHIDRDRANNRIANLRLATEQENKRNRSRQSNNTSGHTGVSWSHQQQAWHARIGLGNRNKKHLGFFDSVEEAGAAYRAAASIHFGEFYLPGNI